MACCQRGCVSGTEWIDALHSFYEYSTKCITEQEKASLFSFKDLTTLLSLCFSLRLSFFSTPGSFCKYKIIIHNYLNNMYINIYTLYSPMNLKVLYIGFNPLNAPSLPLPSMYLVPVEHFNSHSFSQFGDCAGLEAVL